MAKQRHRAVVVTKARFDAQAAGLFEETGKDH